VTKGRIVFSNFEQEQLFGAPSVGTAFRDFAEIHYEDRGKFDQLCTAMTSDSDSQQAVEIRFLLPGPAGGKILRWLYCQTGPIEYLGEKATLVSMVDVSRVKDLEQMMAVREKLASVGELVAGVAHQIRNPLSGINLNLSTLEHLCSSVEVEPEVKEAIRLPIEHAKAASAKIASVVSKVMGLAKPVPVQPDLIDVNRVVDAVAEYARPALRHGGIELQKTVAANASSCRADPHLLEEVLLSLVSNAVQALEGQTGRKLLELSTAAEPDKIVIKVSDSGPGVPDHLRDKIFEPLYTSRKEGYGIGLSFSQRVIASHGGQLSVQTNQWGGAEFRIELPAERSMAAA
jgi:signal transduction histidine kinase